MSHGGAAGDDIHANSTEHQHSGSSRATAMGEIERPLELRSRLNEAAGAPQRGAVVAQRAGQFQR